MEKKKMLTLTSVCIILLVVSIGGNLWLWTLFNQANSEITSLETTVYTKNSEIENLEQEVDSLGSEKEALEAQTSDLEATIDTRNLEIETLESQTTSLQADKNNLQSQVSSLETDKSQLESQVSSLQTDKSSLQTQVNSLNTQIESLNSQITTLNSQITSLDTQITTLQNEIDSLDNTIYVLTTLKLQLSYNWTVYGDPNVMVDGFIKNFGDFPVYNITVTLSFKTITQMSILLIPGDWNQTLNIGTLQPHDHKQISETFTYAQPQSWHSSAIVNLYYDIHWNKSG